MGLYAMSSYMQYIVCWIIHIVKSDCALFRSRLLACKQGLSFVICNDGKVAIFLAESVQAHWFISNKLHILSVPLDTPNFE